MTRRYSAEEVQKALKLAVEVDGATAARQSGSNESTIASGAAGRNTLQLCAGCFGWGLSQIPCKHREVVQNRAKII